MPLTILSDRIGDMAQNVLERFFENVSEKLTMETINIRSNVRAYKGPRDSEDSSVPLYILPSYFF
jgi:hypothetical protein